MKRKVERTFPMKLVVSLAVLILLIGAATEFYHQTEEWGRLDSAYFSVITFTTIGYGDMVPQTDAGRIGTMVFSILGIAVAFHFLLLFGSYIFEKKLSMEERRIKQKFQEKKTKKGSSSKKKSKRKKSGNKS